MADKKHIHPYLDHEKEEHPDAKLLWNSNAAFPVYPLIEQEPAIPEEQTPTLPKLPEENAPEIQPQEPETSEITQETSPSAPDNVELLSSFAQWLISMKPARVSGKTAPPSLIGTRPLSTVESEKKKGKKKKKKKKKEARLSEAKVSLVRKEPDIVTDTLAELMAGQGHKDEAIHMYHTLMRRYPEKAAYYLQKINELREAKD